MNAPTATTPGMTHGFSRALRNGDILLAIAVLVIVAVMIVPLPAGILDLLITLNLSVSITILLIALYVREPLQFSVFPSLLLIVTLFRLALNISSSRLVLLNGYAGQVIQAFGQFVVGGNYVVGIVVFLLLMIIQFAVITNGSGRVAEVAARFTLDAMPGKQMSIDADLNAGLIGEDEARRRRRLIEMESDFYGAMDGASKFVKGEAIAGVAAVIVNIVGGFAIGVLQRGMSLTEALQTYTLLTVGDGLVAQIPALLISASAGIVVTRATSDLGMGSDILQQLFNNPKVTGTVAVVMLAFGLVPGLPKLPFFVLSLLAIGATVMSHRNNKARESKTAERPPAMAPADATQEAYELLKVDPLCVELGYGLIPLVDENMGGGLLDRTSAVRRQIALELGFVLPKVRIRDNLQLPPNGYAIKLRGETIAEGELLPSRLLAMPGLPGTGEGITVDGLEAPEPVYGLPALWIEASSKERAEVAGYTVVDPASVLTTHLAEVIRGHAAELLGRQEVQKLLDNLASEASVLVSEATSDAVGLNLIQKILQNLLSERVSIRDLSSILEAVTSKAREVRDPDLLTEYARQAINRTICNTLREADGKLYVATLGPQSERKLAEAVHATDQGIMVQLNPEVGQALLSRLGEEIEKMAEAGHQPVLICSARIRMPVRRLTQRSLPQLTVLSYSEVPQGVEVYACGMVEVNDGN